MTSWYEPTPARRRASRLSLLLAHVLRERDPSPEQVLAEVYARPKRQRPTTNGGTTK